MGVLILSLCLALNSKLVHQFLVLGVVTICGENSADLKISSQDGSVSG